MGQIKMTLKEFMLKIQNKKDQLVAQNRRALEIGDRHTAQCNANQLVGITYVMTQLDKVR